MSTEGHTRGRRRRRYDVFISYSHLNKTVADTVCAIMERRGVRCWLAPRDITPGLEWAQAIVEAIAECKVFVLIFSASSNASGQVRREVERAANHEVPIIPFRIDECTAHPSLEFFISSPHWLDALTPPLEEHANRLADVVEGFLHPHADLPEPDPGPPAMPAKPAAPPEPEPEPEPAKPVPPAAPQTPTAASAPAEPPRSPPTEAQAPEPPRGRAASAAYVFESDPAPSPTFMNAGLPILIFLALAAVDCFLLPPRGVLGLVAIGPVCVGLVLRRRTWSILGLAAVGFAIDALGSVLLTYATVAGPWSFLVGGAWAFLGPGAFFLLMNRWVLKAPAARFRSRLLRRLIPLSAVLALVTALQGVFLVSVPAFLLFRFLLVMSALALTHMAAPVSVSAARPAEGTQP